MNSELPVIMCTWKRPHRFASTLEWLAEQEGVSPHLYAFNNSPESQDEMEGLAAQSSVPVSIRHGVSNRGSIARFVWARELYRDHPYLVFVDDDQVFGPDALAGLLEEAAPRTIVGVWAFRIDSLESYWDRDKAPPGGEADYVGTGGQILDSSIFDDPDAYRVPPPYAPVEDLWLCHVARLRGWTLRRSAKVIWTPSDDDDLDQWRVLKEEKQELYRYLVAKGFRPLRFRDAVG